MLKLGIETGKEYLKLDSHVKHSEAIGKVARICAICKINFLTKSKGKQTRVTCSRNCQYKLSIPKLWAGRKKVDPNRICAMINCNKICRKWSTLCTTHAGRKASQDEPLRSTWTGMKQRCYNQKSTAYSLYGGRGIQVCARWRYNFQLFKRDMGPKPSPNHSIDRIDNDGNYEPNNCRWATQAEQHSNRRPRQNISGYPGVSPSPKSASLPWRAYVHQQRRQIHLGYFATKDEAIDARLKYKLVNSK